MILYGHPVAEKIYEKIKQEVKIHKAKPGLAILLVGNNPSSEVYVKRKAKITRDLGFHFCLIKLEESVNEEVILSHIERLNHDKSVHGIIVQLPLPKAIDTNHIIERISPEKDVDGLHPINAGKLMQENNTGFIPCTPLGILHLCNFYNIKLEGKHVVILGRSNIVGKPLASLLLQKNKQTNSTVTIAHSLSENLIELTKKADILVAAIGKPLFVKKEMVRNGSIIIDVGVNRLLDQKTGNSVIVGDVDFNAVSSICRAISPCPGGIGPLTIASLLENTWISYLKNTMYI